jgi:hypothetical protein
MSRVLRTKTTKGNQDSVVKGKVRKPGNSNKLQAAIGGAPQKNQKEVVVEVVVASRRREETRAKKLVVRKMDFGGAPHNKEKCNRCREERQSCIGILK